MILVGTAPAFLRSLYVECDLRLGQSDECDLRVLEKEWSSQVGMPSYASVFRSCIRALAWDTIYLSVHGFFVCKVSGGTMGLVFWARLYSE